MEEWIADPTRPQHKVKWEILEPGQCCLCGQRYKAAKSDVDASEPLYLDVVWSTD